jgi:hypothetical protein
MSIWLRWVVANVVGEIVGFGLAAAVGGLVVLTLRGLNGAVAFAAGVVGLVLIGTIEGAAVGQAQWLALRPSLPRLAQRRWLLATIAGAIVAWGTGMGLGTAAGDSQGLAESTQATIVGAVVIGIVAGVLLSAAQWLVLRRLVAHAGWWVPAHAAAWAIGMLAAFGGMSFVQPDTPVALIAVIGAATGLVMGGLVAAITGGALTWMIASSPARQAHPPMAAPGESDDRSCGPPGPARFPTPRASAR